MKERELKQEAMWLLLQKSRKKFRWDNETTGERERWWAEEGLGEPTKPPSFSSMEIRALLAHSHQRGGTFDFTHW